MYITRFFIFILWRVKRHLLLKFSTTFSYDISFLPFWVDPLEPLRSCGHMWIINHRQRCVYGKVLYHPIDMATRNRSNGSSSNTTPFRTKVRTSDWKPVYLVFAQPELSVPLFGWVGILNITVNLLATSWAASPALDRKLSAVLWKSEWHLRYSGTGCSARFEDTLVPRNQVTGLLKFLLWSPGSFDHAAYCLNWDVFVGRELTSISWACEKNLHFEYSWLARDFLCRIFMNEGLCIVCACQRNLA